MWQSMTGNFVQSMFHSICTKNYVQPNVEENFALSFEGGLARAKEFFNHRYGNQINVRGKSVVDVGCGLGYTCIHLAEHGASRVVGIDIDKPKIEYARRKLAEDYRHLCGTVEYQLPEEANGEKFDYVLSFNSFEHYLEPEKFILILKQYVQPDGRLLIAFGPLWKSMWGGHITFMTRFPWAHLLFPEAVIMKERRRFRPDENASTFAQIRGGLNKMTLKRFKKIITDSGFEFEYFRTNTSVRKVMPLNNVLKSIPFCEEYFTIDICSIAHLRA